LSSTAGMCAHNALLDVVITLVILLMLALHQQQLKKTMQQRSDKIVPITSNRSGAASWCLPCCC
jgi:hypothetical protein